MLSYIKIQQVYVTRIADIAKSKKTADYAKCKQTADFPKSKQTADLRKVNQKKSKQKSCCVFTNFSNFFYLYGIILGDCRPKTEFLEL